LAACYSQAQFFVELSAVDFGFDLSGLSLRATDIDWVFGSGAPLSGAAEDLALFMCGRRLPPQRLRGAASSDE
jgi:hypothetical protein